MGKWKNCLHKFPDGKTLMYWSKEHNIHYCIPHKHILSGMTIEQACQTALERRGRRDICAKYRIGGTSVNNYCKQIGISSMCVYNRIKRGLSIEDAVKQVEEKARRKGKIK